MCESPIEQGVSRSLILPANEAWITSSRHQQMVTGVHVPIQCKFNLADEKGHGEKSTIRKRNKWVFSYTDKPQIIDGR